VLDRLWAGVRGRLRGRLWGLSGRLIASYILVTFVVVVLVEALVLCFQVLPLANSARLEAQLQDRVDATAKSYGQQLAQRYPGGVPAGTVLGDPGQPARPGQAPRWRPNGGEPAATRAPRSGPGSRGNSTTRSPSTCSPCG
jgi:hypothetical protein